MTTTTHPEQLEELSIDQLKSLAWDVGHEQAKHSVEYAVATAAKWAIHDEAHRRGACLHAGPILCTSLEHEEQGAVPRWRQEANGREWRCSRCHLWLIGLVKSGRRVYEAVYVDKDFSPYVASGLVKGGRDLLFAGCDPAEGRRQLAGVAREHLAGRESKVAEKEPASTPV